ncbi:helix-turn-helix domain-containing protein [Nocardioides aromaticivorans]|uniref:helix-turn-helix domain-containing protein n=1 Tax=Nocardioides aromaticivorans TaxID=200618 RepID=UPI001A8D24EE|nr:helix-turn-helix domain-containing protein [Nocardioides aromaticivorans]
MTDHNEPRLGGLPVSALLDRDHDALVDIVLEELVAHVPVYDRLPRELIDGDVRRVVDHALRLFPTSLSGGPSTEELASLTESAALRADEGVPMEMVLAAYHRGARVALDHCFGQARPDELDDARTVAITLVDFIERLTTAVAAGFARHGRTVLAEQADARQRLLGALLAGEGYREAAGPAELALPEELLVVRLVVGPHPDEADPDVDREVAARRKLRRLRGEIDRHYAAPVLWQPSVDGGLLLVPSADDGRLRKALRSARRIAGAPVWAAVAVASPAEVAATAPLCDEVMDVVRSTGRPEGTYALADVALDFQLRQASPAQPVLAALLGPLDEHPDLLRTLEVHQRAGMSRRRAAVELAVHPNTVDNRLRRVAELTGLDPTDPSAVPIIWAALMARAVVR